MKYWLCFILFLSLTSNPIYNTQAISLESFEYINMDGDLFNLTFWESDYILLAFPDIGEVENAFNTQNKELYYGFNHSQIDLVTIVLNHPTNWFENEIPEVYREYVYKKLPNTFGHLGVPLDYSQLTELYNAYLNHYLIIKINPFEIIFEDTGDYSAAYTVLINEGISLTTKLKNKDIPNNISFPLWIPPIMLSCLLFWRKKRE